MSALIVHLLSKLLEAESAQFAFAPFLEVVPCYGSEDGNEDHDDECEHLCIETIAFDT